MQLNGQLNSKDTYTCQNQSPLSRLDFPGKQQKYIYISKSKFVESALNSSSTASSTVKILGSFPLSQLDRQLNSKNTYICIFTVELVVELKCRVGSTDIDQNICISIFTVELAVDLKCRAGSTDFDFDIYICIFAVELALELECRTGSTDIGRRICTSVFTVELAVELECRPGSTDFDFDIYMYFCC